MERDLSTELHRVQELQLENKKLSAQLLEVSLKRIPFSVRENTFI